MHADASAPLHPFNVAIVSHMIVAWLHLVAFGGFGFGPRNSRRPLLTPGPPPPLGERPTRNLADNPANDDGRHRGASASFICCCSLLGAVTATPPHLPRPTAVSRIPCARDLLDRTSLMLQDAEIGCINVE
jgi:hypothetical protein